MSGAIAGEVEVEAVPPQHQVEAGRVAAAHFEPIECRQRDLHRRHHLDRSVTCIAAREVSDCERVAQPVAVHRPHRVLQADERRIRVLEPRRRHTGFVEPALECLQLELEGEAGRFDARDRGRRRQQGAKPREALQL